jgi:hypothetical protein
MKLVLLSLWFTGIVYVGHIPKSAADRTRGSFRAQQSFKFRATSPISSERIRAPRLSDVVARLAPLKPDDARLPAQVLDNNERGHVPALTERTYEASAPL